jgi:two-component system response regulator PhoP
MRVLIVEDEPRLAKNIATAVREGPGYAVDLTADGQEALFLCSTRDYDLVLLDLMIPKLSGKEVVRRLRAADNSAPVLVLTAVSETASTIDLLNLGADDYMTKPFDLGELIARMRSLVRRGKGVSQSILTFGNIRLNTAEQTVISGPESVNLSPTEFRILEYLMHRPRTVVSKRELLEHLYDFTWEHHSNVIEAHVSNLRKKLRLSIDSTGLETLRGRGYRLMANGEL